MNRPTCADTRCNNPVAKEGDYCDEHKREQERELLELEGDQIEKDHRRREQARRKGHVCQ